MYHRLNSSLPWDLLHILLGFSLWMVPNVHVITKIYMYVAFPCSRHLCPACWMDGSSATGLPNCDWKKILNKDGVCKMAMFVFALPFLTSIENLFVSFLSHFWLINFCLTYTALSTKSRPLSSYMCSITPETAKVGSSYSHMRGPGIDCWFSDGSNCSHWSFGAAVLPINFNIYTDQWEPIVIYQSITLLVLIQLYNPRCWHLDSNYCRTRWRQSQLRFLLSQLLLHLRLLGTFQSDFPLCTLTWPATHSPNQGWESTHRLHLYPLGGVF